MEQPVHLQQKEYPDGRRGQIEFGGWTTMATRKRRSTAENRPVPLGTVIKTLGHGTRSVVELLAILQAEGVKHVVDVRSIPRSRHNPQFNSDTLSAALAAIGIGYMHMPSLGGLRHPHKDSPNDAWRNASFRGFADYMQTPAFDKALEDLQCLHQETSVVLLYAETVPWHCHRSLIADALSVRSVAVEHISQAGHRRAHRMTPWARVKEGHVPYPLEKTSQ